MHDCPVLRAANIDAAVIASKVDMKVRQDAGDSTTTLGKLVRLGPPLRLKIV
jgi:hypothetical protein